MTNLLLLDRQGLTEQWATEPSDHKYREGVWGVCVQISFKTDSFSSKWKYFSAVYSAAALLLSAVPTPVSRTFFFFFVTPQRSYQRVWSCCLHELHTQLSRKMSKKYESANVSEVEDHISLKYEIKKRLGKGVSDCLSLDFLLDPIKFEVNSLKSRRPEIRTNLLHAPLTWIPLLKMLHQPPLHLYTFKPTLYFALKRNSSNYPDLSFSVNTSVVSTGVYLLWQDKLFPCGSADAWGHLFPPESKPFCFSLPLPQD